MVFRLLADHKLHVNPKKCQFLGHWISAHGVSTDKAKVKAMESWPVPKSLKKLHGFLGLTGYYWQFFKDYGLKAAPLTAHLKKDTFQWQPEAQLAFGMLKLAMSSTPKLVLPNFTLPLIIETNASGIRLGDVLVQSG